MKILLLIGLFTFGIAVGILLDKTEKVRYVNVPAADSKIDENKQKDWVALKEADDRLLASCSENFGIAVDIFSAQTSDDIELLGNKTLELEKGAQHAEELAGERSAILKRLGY